MRLSQIVESRVSSVNYKQIQQKEVFEELKYDDWQYDFELGTVFRGNNKKWSESPMGVIFTSLNPLQAAEYGEVTALNPNVSHTADLEPFIEPAEDANEYLLKIEKAAIKLAQNNQGFDSAYIMTNTGWMDGPELILFEPNKVEVLGRVEIGWDTNTIRIKNIDHVVS